MTTKVSFKKGSINIEESNGEVFLFIDKDVVPFVNITAKNSGVPGVIGPDVDVRLKDVIKEINGKALGSAFPDALS